jgi:hypothetical protein
MLSFPCVAVLPKSVYELFMTDIIQNGNVYLLISQIEIDRDQSLRQNSPSYTQALDLAVRGLHR